MKIEQDKNLSELNSFKLSANSSYFVELHTLDDFNDFFKIKNTLPNPFYVLGGGNNSIFIEDYKGTIIKVNNQGISTIYEDDREAVLEIQAGVDWNELVEFTLAKGYFGLENLIDIPGQVGSAPIQNIGAYGAEVKDVIQSVQFFDFNQGTFKTFNNEDCKFGYRSSIFKHELNGKGIISSVTMKFPKESTLKYEYGNIKEGLKSQGISKPTQQELASIIREIRASKLPDPKVVGNAGSFFKNPIIDAEQYDKLIKEFPEAVTFALPNQKYKVAAGWLIDYAGWKGKGLKNVAVHSKQALVLINKTGNATGAELLDLAHNIISDIYIKFHIKLVPEVNIIK